MGRGIARPSEEAAEPSPEPVPPALNVGAPGFGAPLEALRAPGFGALGLAGPGFAPGLAAPGFGVEAAAGAEPPAEPDWPGLAEPGFAAEPDEVAPAPGRPGFGALGLAEPGFAPGFGAPDADAPGPGLAAGAAGFGVPAWVAAPVAAEVCGAEAFPAGAAFCASSAPSFLGA